MRPVKPHRNSYYMYLSISVNYKIMGKHKWTSIRALPCRQFRSGFNKHESSGFIQKHSSPDRNMFFIILSYEIERSSSDMTHVAKTLFCRGESVTGNFYSYISFERRRFKTFCLGLIMNYGSCIFSVIEIVITVIYRLFLFSIGNNRSRLCIGYQTTLLEIPSIDLRLEKFDSFICS